MQSLPVATEKNRRTHELGFSIIVPDGWSVDMIEESEVTPAMIVAEANIPLQREAAVWLSVARVGETPQIPPEATRIRLAGREALQIARYEPDSFDSPEQLVVLVFLEDCHTWWCVQCALTGMGQVLPDRLWSYVESFRCD